MEALRCSTLNCLLAGGQGATFLTSLCLSLPIFIMEGKMYTYFKASMVLFTMFSPMFPSHFLIPGDSVGFHRGSTKQNYNQSLI